MYIYIYIYIYIYVYVLFYFMPLFANFMAQGKCLVKTSYKNLKQTSSK